MREERIPALVILAVVSLVRVLAQETHATANSTIKRTAYLRVDYGLQQQRDGTVRCSAWLDRLFISLLLLC